VANTIRIKRGTGSTAPSALANAELAFAEGSETLYIGKGTSGGSAASVVAIAGAGAYLSLDAGATQTAAGDYTFSGDVVFASGGSVSLGSAATAATQAATDDSTKVATTAFVQDVVSALPAQGVTSVGLSLPTSVFTVSGSPVTGSGTLTGTLKTQTANTFFSGPTSGADATPAFRSLVSGDIPDLSSTYLTTTAASTTYLTKTDASSTYLTQSSASSTYLTITNASNTYLPLTGGTLSSALTINGDLTVNGNTTTINSNVTTLDDPVFVLGGDTAPTTNDGKDRGIEFSYYDSQARTGFFGWDNDGAEFVLFKNATNTAEEFSGTVAHLNATVSFNNIQSKPTTLTGYGITDAQPLDAELTAIAGLTSAADKAIYFTGSGTAALADFTSVGRSVVGASTTTAARNALGLGTMATQNANSVAITGGTIDGVTIDGGSF
jgi:hypothetical protein